MCFVQAVPIALEVAPTTTSIQMTTSHLHHGVHHRRRSQDRVLSASRVRRRGLIYAVVVEVTGTLGVGIMTTTRMMAMNICLDVTTQDGEGGSG